MNRYIVGLTGASGIVYGVRLLEVLLSSGTEVHLVMTDPARIVLEHELEWGFEQDWQETVRKQLPQGSLKIYDNQDIAAPIASGSFRVDGMVVIPCTMAAISAFATGSSRTLMERAADVMLKEKKPLILVPRETPLSSIHLRNMLTLAESGAHIIPAMPAFYSQPESVDDLVDFMTGKVLDAIGLDHDLFERYGADR